MTSLSIAVCFPFPYILGLSLPCVDGFSPSCSLSLYVAIFIPSWLFIYLYVAEVSLRIKGRSMIRTYYILTIHYTEPCKSIVQPSHMDLFSTHQKVTMSPTERYIELTQTILYESSKSTANPQTRFEISEGISGTLIIPCFFSQNQLLYFGETFLSWHKPQ